MFYGFAWEGVTALDGLCSSLLCLQHQVQHRGVKVAYEGNVLLFSWQESGGMGQPYSFLPADTALQPHGVGTPLLRPDLTPLTSLPPEMKKESRGESQL